MIEEREKYNANSILPRLTGCAQINGRDELSIKEKSKYDGDFEKLSFVTDVKCFILTIISVMKKDGIVEGKAKE